MACKMRCRWLTFRRCFVNRALSRNRSLRDAKPARHLFVWLAKHCLAEHCLSFRGDADECEKQFCFVFRICLAFFDSRLWRPLAHLQFLVCVTPKQKNCLIRETANQQSISSHMVVYIACKIRCRWLTFRRCFVNRALSRNRSLRDAKPARHLFVWLAKHCLAEHCLSFRGDADECEKQFCFVFRICLAFFDSRLWRPLAHLQFLVCVTPKQKNCLIRETANQQSISSHMVVYIACKIRCRWLTFRRCFVNRALSRNRSLRDAKPPRHLFVWFAKHCLAEHCLSFRGDADECEKQFCFVFRICLAVFDSRLWRPLRRRVRYNTPIKVDNIFCFRKKNTGIKAYQFVQFYHQFILNPWKPN